MLILPHFQCSEFSIQPDVQPHSYLENDYSLQDPDLPFQGG